jgi:rod shape-determining protein MreC
MIVKNKYNNSYSKNKKFVSVFTFIRKIFYSTFLFLYKINYYVFILISILLIFFNKKKPEYYTDFRNTILFMSKPLYYVIETPVNLLYDTFDSVKKIIFVYSINAKLEIENIELKEKYLKSKDIESENEKLKKILQFNDILKPLYKTISTRVFLTTNNSINRILSINIGKNNGLKENSIVIGVNKGVIGRTFNVNDNYSEILLLNDINSRIVARTQKTKEIIILKGENEKYLSVIHTKSKKPSFEDGDLVFTSKDGDVLPDGFFVGIIRKINNNFFVEIGEDINTIFDVLIVLKDNNKDNDSNN